jgi:hypothetical protein
MSTSRFVNFMQYNFYLLTVFCYSSSLHVRDPERLGSLQPLIALTVRFLHTFIKEVLP